MLYTLIILGPSHNEKHSPEINQTPLNSTETEEQPPAADPTGKCWLTVAYPTGKCRLTVAYPTGKRWLTVADNKG